MGARAMNRLSWPRWRRPLLGVALALALAPAGAASLWDVWQAARQHDPAAAIAQAAQAVGVARGEQARVLWRPQAQAQLSAGAMGASSTVRGASFSAPGMAPATGVAFATQADPGAGLRWSVGARLPLVSPQRSAQQRALEAAAALAGSQAASTWQGLDLQLAQRYFDAVMADQALALLQRQHRAAERALQEAQDRFRLGDNPVTDVHEAQAHVRGLAAQVLDARIQRDSARQALADTTGRAEGWAVLDSPVAVEQLPALPPLAQWLAQVEARHPGLRQQQQAVALARAQAAEAARGSGVALDLVAQASREHLSGSGRYSAASASASQQMLGLQLTVPLSTGGLQPARERELLALADQAEAEYQRQRQQVLREARQGWQQLDTAAARTAALQAAAEASHARRDATELGRQVGDRTTLEVLLAQNDEAAAQLALLQWRARAALLRLQVLALGDALDDAALRAATQADTALHSAGLAD